MTTKKISVSLTEELNHNIQSAVGTGAYKSSSEVVREALRQWQAKRERNALEVEQLRQAVEHGQRSGEPIEVNASFFEEKRAMIRKLGTV